MKIVPSHLELPLCPSPLASPEAIVSLALSAGSPGNMQSPRPIFPTTDVAKPVTRGKLRFNWLVLILVAPPEWACFTFPIFPYLQHKGGCQTRSSNRILHSWLLVLVTGRKQRTCLTPKPSWCLIKSLCPRTESLMEIFFQLKNPFIHFFLGNS